LAKNEQKILKKAH